MNFKRLNIFTHNKTEVKDFDAAGRNKNIFRQIAGLGLLRVLGIGLNFLVIPYMLAVLGNELFGIWTTILSIASWITIMDIGVGNGLRNKLAECFAKGDYLKARKYISTAYFTLAAILTGVFLLFLIISFFVNWQSIFNTTTLSVTYIRNVVIIVVLAIIINFVLSLVNQIINALQRSSLSSIGSVIAFMLLLVSLIVFKSSLNGNMQGLAIAYSVTLLIAILVVSVLLFSEYKNLIPSIKYFRRDYIRDILSLGIKFFIIQIAGVVIFTTDSFIITQILGPAEVTAYSVTLKVYSAIIMFCGLLMTPFWSAYTEAYIKGEIDWIKSRIKIQNLILLAVAIGVTVLTLFFDFFIKLWIKEPLNIPHYLPALAGLYAILSVWCNIYGFVLGGINKIRLGAMVTLFVSLINIPLSIFFVKHTSLGSGGVMLGTIISQLFTAIVSPLQVRYFIYRTKKTDFLTKLYS